MKVEYIDHMGSDLSVVRAATASFAKDPEEWDTIKHQRLINYLARGMTQADYEQLLMRVASLGFDYFDKDDGNAHYAAEHLHLELEQYRHTPTHWSPFAHTAITLRLKAPIAIHAQFMKHTVGFAHNTVSRRYVSDTPEVFTPIFREAPQGNIKQGSGDEIDIMYYACDGSSLEPTIEFMSSDKTEVEKFVETAGKKLFITSKNQDDLFTAYRVVCQEAVETYNNLVKLGVSPEQARFILPQGVMTEWVSTGSLYAWARLYRLRTDSHAQEEIQELAEQIGRIIEPLFSCSWSALTGGVKMAKNQSKEGIKGVSR